MEVKVLLEAGYEQALLGMGLSYGVDDLERLSIISKKLAPKDMGHNKFLESLVVWLSIKAPRYFWQEFDTYRVGTTKQSQSTIHTLCRQPLSVKDFEEGDDKYNRALFNIIEALNEDIYVYNNTKDENEKERSFRLIKNNLPEGYLQTRMVCTNYKVIKNICNQREKHRLKEWQIFINEMKIQLMYADYIFN